MLKPPRGNTTTLNVEKNERICTIKRKLKEKEGISSDMHLFRKGRLLEDGHTLAHYKILKESTLHLFLSLDALANEPFFLSVRTWSRNIFYLEVKLEDSIDDVKAKIQESEGIPSHKQLLFSLGKWLRDGSRTLAYYRIYNYCTLNLAIQPELGAAASQTKRAQLATSIEVCVCIVYILELKELTNPIKDS